VTSPPPILGSFVERLIGEERLADGATIVGAARVVEEIVNGARTVAFA
jgi:hypothetical protein